MPIPSFHFYDPSLGLPPQPVPVRFACFAANWSIGMLATALSPEDAFNGRLLLAYEFDAVTGYIGEVAPGFYGQFRGLSFPIPETLASIPANHFVWSDDLIRAYSAFVDLTSNREDAHAEAAGVRWVPALGDCANVVSQSVDFSQLSPCDIDTASTFNKIYCVNDICTFEFRGSTEQLRNSKGIRYINYLLTHASENISAADLYRMINPPLALDSSSSSVSEVVGSLCRDEDDSSGFEGSHGGKYDPVIDGKTKESVWAKYKELEGAIEEAMAQQKFEEVERLQDEQDVLVAYMKGATNLRGQAKSFNHDAEKMRKAVAIAIVRAIQQIKEIHPDLGKYLNEKIKTGHACLFVGEAWLNSPEQRT